jgi:hypothetical protein
VGNTDKIITAQCDEGQIRGRIGLMYMEEFLFPSSKMKESSEKGSHVVYLRQDLKKE